MTATSFSEATFNATVANINGGVSGLSTKLGELRTGVSSFLSSSWVPGWVKDIVSPAFDKIYNAMSEFLGKLKELLEGVAAPVLFFKRAWDWSDDVKAPMMDLNDAVSEKRLIDQDSWDGKGYRAYKKAVSDQSEAAKAVGDIGHGMSVSLGACAASGAAFYVALGVIIYECLSVLVASLVAIGSGVFTAPGLSMLAADITITAAQVWAVVGTLAASLATQAASMIGMKNALDAFPGNQWPAATRE